jgi:carboxylate-amine ligase
MSTVTDRNTASSGTEPFPPLTLGVEEEFLLLDPATGQNVPVAEDVLAALPAAARRQSRLEFRRSTVEMVTPVCTGLLEVHRSLTRLRRAAAVFFF